MRYENAGRVGKAVIGCARRDADSSDPSAGDSILRDAILARRTGQSIRDDKFRGVGDGEGNGKSVIQPCKRWRESSSNQKVWEMLVIDSHNP